MQSNDISPAGAQAIAETLKQIILALQLLIWQSNDIGAAGAQAIAEALKQIILALQLLICQITKSAMKEHGL